MPAPAHSGKGAKVTDYSSMQRAYISAAGMFSKTVLCNTSGVTVFESEKPAVFDSLRLSNALTKNQWFSILIPPPGSFLSLDGPMSGQPYEAVHSLCSQEALSVLFIRECREFLPRLDSYLLEIGEADNPAAAQAEVHEFYHEKRRQILSMKTSDYIDLIYTMNSAPNPDKVSAYLSHFGIAGFSYLNQSRSCNSFFMFNPRKHIVIKSVMRECIGNTRLAS
jgi:hypothetical protein